MEYIKTLWKNKKTIWQLGKSDFKNRFASTSLGSIWGFLQPFVFMITYVIVFEYILKTGSSGEYAYAVWFIPGIAMWQTLNDMIMAASGSIRQYSYLVKKVVFPVDVIPNIAIVASSFVGVFLFLVAIVVGFVYGCIPNFITFIYILLAMFCFVIAFTRFTSAITTIVPDFANLLAIAMQLFFWFTPIIWNLSMLANHPFLLKIIKCMPFTYLVTGMREVFIDETNIITGSYGIHTIIFWLVTIIMFVWGNSVFKRNKKDFADVL